MGFWAQKNVIRRSPLGLSTDSHARSTAVTGWLSSKCAASRGIPGLMHSVCEIRIEIIYVNVRIIDPKFSIFS